MGTEPTEGAAFREALARFASGVVVVTACGESGPVGFTATGFTSVSLAPPLILVCVGKRASAHSGVVGAARFGVSILSEHQTHIAEQFARPRIDRFRDVLLCVANVPLIDGAVARLECQRYAQHDAGDHTILLGEVHETWIGTGRPLLHYLRRFGAFAVESAPRGKAAVNGTWKGPHV